MPAPLTHNHTQFLWIYSHDTGYRVSAQREDMVGDWKVVTGRAWGISSIRADLLDTRVWSPVFQELSQCSVWKWQETVFLPTHTQWHRHST